MDRALTRALIALALSAAAFRLLPLGWLHPLNFDEIEFFRATDWVCRGLVPFRDFWEHHTPLQWLVFAPFTALTRSEGTGAVVFMRWMQVPLWIVTFWLANLWMRRLAIAAYARWAAMALALSSSFLMIAAVEYRVDVLGCALYLAGLVMAMRVAEGRGWVVGAGIAFFLAGFANLRLGPLLAVTVVVLWFFDRRTWWSVVGVLAAAIVALGAFAAAGALDDLVRQVWYENYLGDKLSEELPRRFQHRLLVPFGIHLLGAKVTFDPVTIDPGGAALLVLGAIGVIRALRGVRARDPRAAAAILQIVSIAFIASMKVVFNYHFMIVALMMLPFVAMEVERVKRRELVLAIVVAAWCVNAFASVFRGKELDREYQDVIMRAAHRVTKPGEKVWDGAGFALRREPAYRFWFLPALADVLVRHGHAEPYDLLRNPPAAIVTDHLALKWLVQHRELRRLVVTHYLPLWRDLWIPAPSARLTPTRPRMTWTVLRDGRYRVYASPALANHPWFRAPVWVGVYERPDAARFPVRLGAPVTHPELRWSAPVVGGRVSLRKGQQLSVEWRGAQPIGVMLVPDDHAAMFRQPPPTATLEAAYPRVTHVPRLAARR